MAVIIPDSSVFAVVFPYTGGLRKGSVTMRQTIGAGLLLLLLLFLPPWLRAGETANTGGTAAPLQTEQSVPDSGTGSDAAHTVRLWNGSAVETMTAAEYLPGVVRGEMPAAFETEALKAQAVAERTYLYYRMASAPKDSHPDADVCTDPACCTAWLSETDARAKWGDKFDQCEVKIQQAVTDTDGQVVLYEGAPIMAVFHSSSAGATAASGDVWAAELPYLVSVKSPESPDSVPNYYSVNTFTAESFRTAFLAAHPEAKLSGDTGGWIRDVLLTDTGRVASATVGGVSITGKELRSLYGLRSTAFTVEASGDSVIFRVTGYGHGVGMSQYGANELAKEGKTWQEILQWYYTGVTIGLYNG